MTYTISGVLFTHSVDPCELVRVAFPELTPTGADEMSPQPMSDAEIASALGTDQDSPVFVAFKAIAVASIAARDAQWAAMIGEPVAWLDDIGNVLCFVPSSARKVTPLYAIKETP